MRSRPWLLPVLALAVVAAACSDGGTDDAAPGRDVQRADRAPAGTGSEPAESAEDDESGEVGAGPGLVGRGDLTPAGNRVIAGRGALGTSSPIDVELPAVPIWVLPAMATGDDRASWVVELDDGRRLLVDREGIRTDQPPPAPAVADLGGIDDPLPDGRVVVDGETRVALVGPTDRYPHGVLGDRLEAAAIQVVDGTTGTDRTFGPEPPTVIEGIAPLLADVTGDGGVEILVTQSNAQVGAWLALWSLEGELLAESDPIGQGNRWRNQLAVAPLGPGGEVEVVDVRTPHLGGTVEYFRLEGDRLALTASRSGFTSHVIGSRNLDLAVVADGNGDGTLDVLAPTDDRRELGVLTRVGDQAEVVALVPLGGRLTSNLGVQADRAGGLTIAVGTDDGRLRIWPARTGT